MVAANGNILGLHHLNLLHKCGGPLHEVVIYQGGLHKNFGHSEVTDNTFNQLDNDLTDDNEVKVQLYTLGWFSAAGDRSALTYNLGIKPV